jgi:predicted N-acyltransferase
VPFTPATGRRILSEDKYKRTLIDGAVEVARRFEVSSLHATFPDEQDWKAMAEAGWLQREDQQFHWFNENYRDFQDFLDSLASRKRKQIRKEREQAASAGIEIEIFSGAELTEGHWDAFFQFYMDTGSRKWGRPYLNRKFFSLVSAQMAGDIVLVLCRRNGRWIAGALNFKGSDALFGRNWGCVEDHPFLHFEACYYQAIDYAIRHKLARVEAGAQGPHKLARGYRPTLTYSAHWIRDRGFRDAVANYLKQERRAVEHQIEVLDTHLPFRHVEPLEEEP